ncbi:Alpha/Beta hydrolase protein [Truncatella angustata]|uniref:Alpha/Beta hydrolase protein n=1 Tax=Truncatella angustata TaxID=152316 RepID=A0A9P8UVH8_9PEZI|nr:Alpha/Beta hydrolase protein [Truncatella angustata]KAH6659143.1 Alpha/Beta hydrolase protein [Truncatella angustata]
MGGASRNLRRGSSSTFKFIALGALVCFAIFQFPWRPTYKHHHQCDASFDGKYKYPGEKITWEICGELIGRKLECSEIDVPMDQFNAENSGNKTFSIPLIRLRGKNATQNVLLNPGGPGGSGIEFLYRKGEQLNAYIGEGFHLLSFDPRGVNGSRPRASCYPSQEARRELSPVRSEKVIEDSAETYAWSKNFVAACPDTMGEHGSYINTPQTAADMNSILEAVGQKDMVYWGFSYGTVLGQTYATLFPERSERVIIDGVVNNFEWYEDRFYTESLSDTERVMSGFFDECIKSGKNCTLSSLAKTKEELQDKVLSFIDKLEEPLSVYVNNTSWGQLTREKILNTAIFPALYKPANWYVLADRLAKLLQGNATEAFLAYGGKGPFDGIFQDDSNVHVENNDGMTGSQYWPQGREELLDLILPFMNTSLFAQFTNSGLYTKQQWAVHKTHQFVQKLGVKTAHPLLILSTTYDPVCPLISARSANAAFEGSQMIELRGYGHCTLAMPSNCIAKHVRAFLYNGTLPANYTQCDVDGPYFFKPEENGTPVAALRHFEQTEDQRIHRAQVEIAMDESWPYVW